MGDVYARSVVMLPNGGIALKRGHLIANDPAKPAPAPVAASHDELVEAHVAAFGPIWARSRAAMDADAMAAQAQYTGAAYYGAALTSSPPPASSGATCARCGDHNEYAEPNQPDGSFKCYRCRHGGI